MLQTTDRDSTWTRCFLWFPACPWRSYWCLMSDSFFFADCLQQHCTYLLHCGSEIQRKKSSFPTISNLISFLHSWRFLHFYCIIIAHNYKHKFLFKCCLISLCNLGLFIPSLSVEKWALKALLEKALLDKQLLLFVYVALDCLTLPFLPRLQMGSPQISVIGDLSFDRG